MQVTPNLTSRHRIPILSNRNKSSTDGHALNSHHYARIVQKPQEHNTGREQKKSEQWHSVPCKTLIPMEIFLARSLHTIGILWTKSTRKTSSFPISQMDTMDKPYFWFHNTHIYLDVIVRWHIFDTFDLRHIWFGFWYRIHWSLEATNMHGPAGIFTASKVDINYMRGFICVWALHFFPPTWRRTHIQHTFTQCVLEIAKHISTQRNGCKT